MPVSAAYSILLKKENANSAPLYCCAWATIKPTAGSKAPAQDYIVTGGLDKLVRVWKFENNKLEPVHTLYGHGMSLVSVAVSPDGHTIASTSLDSGLIIWDLISGNTVYNVLTDSAGAWQVAFSPDGTQLVSGGHAGKLVVYGMERLTKDIVLDTRRPFAISVAWSDNGKYLASGSTDGSVCVFDAAQGRLLLTVEAHEGVVRSVAFAHGARLLATASHDGKVKVYTVASANLQSTLDLKTWARDARFSPDGTRVVTAADDGSVRVALTDGLNVIHTFQEHTDAVWGVQFNATGDKLVSVSKDRSINIYECQLPPKAGAKK